jgi:hypothetical protein
VRTLPQWVFLLLDARLAIVTVVNAKSMKNQKNPFNQWKLKNQN